MYGFEGEVKDKYSQLMMDLFSEVFNWLPLAHCIENKILVSLVIQVSGSLQLEENKYWSVWLCIET